MALRLGLIGITDGRELEAALSADNIEVAGFYGQQEPLMQELADYHALEATGDWRTLLTADALVVGPPLNSPGAVVSEIAAAGKPLLLRSELLAAPDALAWTSDLAAAEAMASVALTAAVDAGMAHGRDLVRAGVFGDLLGVEVRTSSDGPLPAAWQALVSDLGAALWVSGLEPTDVWALGAHTQGAAYISAVVASEQGVPITVSLRASAPGGAHRDVLAPRIMGSQGQLLLTHEPQSWFVKASESNRSREWEELVYAGPRGDLTRSLMAFADAVSREEQAPLSLAACLPLVRVLSELRVALS